MPLSLQYHLSLCGISSLLLYTPEELKKALRGGGATVTSPGSVN